MISRNANSPLNTNGLVTLSEPNSAASEAYRLLRTNVQFNSLDKPLHSLLVTSAKPNEGKSSVVANLAVVFAQLDSRVVLVDADLRHPSLHYLFGVSNEAGLTTHILKNANSLNSNNRSAYTGNLPLVQTSVPNLKLLTAGPLPPNPAEVLGSGAMRELIEQIGQTADIILFDAPPVLSVTDASILAPFMDGVVLVFRAGHTKREDSQEAKAQLEKVHARILGAVLSDVKGLKNSYSY